MGEQQKKRIKQELDRKYVYNQYYLQMQVIIWNLFIFTQYTYVHHQYYLQTQVIISVLFIFAQYLYKIFMAAFPLNTDILLSVHIVYINTPKNALFHQSSHSNSMELN